MGAALSRVGSETYYASYERNFERLKADCIKLQVLDAGAEQHPDKCNHGMHAQAH